MSDVLRYEGRITKKRFLRAQRVHLGSRWVVAVLTLLLFPVVMSSLAFSGSFANVDPWWLTKWSFGFPVIMGALTYWRWGRLYRKSRYLAGPVKGELSKAGMTIHFANASSDLKWQLFEKVRHSAGLMLLYQSPLAFNILSRDFFASDGDWQQAVALVDRHVGHGRNRSAA